MSSVFPVLGSVNLSGATSIIRKEHDYIQEHQIAGKDGGLVERVGSASTRWEIKGALRESGADGDYNSLKALLGSISNLSIPMFNSGYNLCASGTNVFVESFGGNWMPGYGYPRYDYSLKLVSTTTPAKILPIPLVVKILQKASGSTTGGNNVSAVFPGAVTIGNTIIAVAAGRNGTPAGATFLTYTCTDNVSNSYSLAKQSTDQGNNLGAAIFSAPITIGGTPTVTISKATGTVSNPNWIIEIYEVQGLASSTAASTGETQGGSLPIATNTTGAIIVSMINVNITGGAGQSASFTGTNLDNNGGEYGIGTGTGSWNVSLGGGVLSFAEELDASFN